MARNGEESVLAVTLGMENLAVDRIDWSYDSSNMEGKEVGHILETFRFLA